MGQFGLVVEGAGGGRGSGNEDTEEKREKRLQISF